jgi:hypothetical protein
MTPKYDFSKFPSKYPATVRYSAVSHVRGRLHMTRLRLDNFYILMGKGPGDRKMTRPGVFEWYLEDQAELIQRALSETPLLPEKEAA